MDPNILFSHQTENRSGAASSIVSSNESEDEGSLKNPSYSRSFNDVNPEFEDDGLSDSDDFSDGDDLSDTAIEAFHIDNEEDLPEHACAYCGIHACNSVVQCKHCEKWFCNSKGSSTSSHIITHLVMSKHNSVALHPDSELGDDTLECYHCGNKNVFVLGLISAKSEAVMVMLCRLPCSQAKDSRWDSTEWQALIENREFVSWIAHKPTEEDSINCRMISNSQIAKLEAKWRLNKDATIADVDNVEEEDEKVEPILLRYEDAYGHQRAFGPLVQREADCDKALKESQALEHISVRWSIALNNKHLASFALSTFESSSLKVAVGDEMILRYAGVGHAPWEGKGFIIRTPSSHQEEFTLELIDTKTPPPTTLTTDFTAEFVWKGTPYERMQNALRSFAVDPKSVSAYLYKRLLGHQIEQEVEFDVSLPQKVSVTGYAELNLSQANAVKAVLKKPLSLIQGPPGTGKTVTSATIVYHLTKLNAKEKILVCAPSNVAVDHLAEKLESLGLNIVRLTARSREDVDCSVEHLSLNNLVAKNAVGELKKLLKLRGELGELSAEDTTTFFRLFRKKERAILKNADVVCCTCIGAGDIRLHNMTFSAVLIDEVTQASEPECLVPIVHGAKQVILVGDHQQLGPVILDKRAAEAGLKQSLFERLIHLNHIPIRLEVQYRMNPCLAEFASNMFYEGDLHSGVTKEDRRMSSKFPWPVPDTPMMFWANYGREEISATGTSYLNRIEAMNCERVITRLFREGVKPEQIGVITPYEGQRAYIVSYMTMNGSMDKDLYLDVEVASVDAFQGREKDFIVFSCARANEGQNIGFLRDPRRLNVALTRAKYGLIVLGNPRTLKKNHLWNQLLLHFRENGCLVEGPLDNLQLSSAPLENFAKNFRANKHRQEYEQYGFAASTIQGGSTIHDYDTASLVSFVPGSDVSFARGNSSVYPAFFNKNMWPSIADSYDGKDNKKNEGQSAGDDSDSETEKKYNLDRQINSAFSGKLDKMDERLAQTLKAMNLNGGFGNRFG
ncbi:CYFA0S05e03906g1_1 [Cyberlindnera fabianii]|uniref:CYFA0S05e03906g1_1 n=1 Tax=Cyberlindnera fabianii TaxID=36022 RepID=A0A061AZB2_CYBFA|nr:CYFA0S05e03906g1_1 [Cyberlindnera fabianii]